MFPTPPQPPSESGKEYFSTSERVPDVPSAPGEAKEYLTLRSIRRPLKPPRAKRKGKGGISTLRVRVPAVLQPPERTKSISTLRVEFRPPPSAPSEAKVSRPLRSSSRRPPQPPSEAKEYLDAPIRVPGLPSSDDQKPSRRSPLRASTCLLPDARCPGFRVRQRLFETFVQVIWDLPQSNRSPRSLDRLAN